jgi:hypothetical protein
MAFSIMTLDIMLSVANKLIILSVVMLNVVVTLPWQQCDQIVQNFAARVNFLLNQYSRRQAVSANGLL